MKKMLAIMSAFAVLSSVSMAGFAAVPMKKDGVKKPGTEKQMTTKPPVKKEKGMTGGAASVKKHKGIQHCDRSGKKY